MILRAKIYIHIFITLLLFAASTQCFSQYPHYFVYDNENGLPSNEVYSIVQDQKGFIWIGCDAGLFKFDGVRYIPYKCTSQKSNPITGLTFTSSGKLYCFNFQSQIFYLEHDTLRELKHSLYKISSLVTDKTEILYINHSNGIALFNENKWQWITGSLNSPTDRSAIISSKNEVHFIMSLGMGVIKNGKAIIKNCKNTFSESGKLLMEEWQDEHFIFSIGRNIIFREKNGVITEIKNTPLNSVLFNRKITNINRLPDGKLWICTYKGIVEYNPSNDSAKLYYPELSFSDCLIDREGNYWLSTLQEGLMRIPNLKFEVWNKENESLKNDNLSKIATDHTHLFFSTVNGSIGRLNTRTFALKVFHTGNNADVQSLDYDFTDNRLYFNINKHLYFLHNNSLDEKANEILTVKSILKVKQKYFLASSFGTYVESVKDSIYKISDSWSREFRYDPINNCVWAAANEGLQKFTFQNEKWNWNSTLLTGEQVISIDFDQHRQTLYAVTFDGKIYTTSASGKVQLQNTLPENVQPNKIKYHKLRLYVATNKGLWIYNLEAHKWESMNVLSGLVSDNIQDFVILNETLWLATGKGLQKIPIESNLEIPSAKIYLKKIVADTRTLFDFSEVRIYYGQILSLHPEVSIYSSNGNFQYVYRIRNMDTSWNFLPSSVERIAISNIPSGDFEIELKAIDHKARDSGNVIIVKGYVIPPFWKSIWFLSLLLVFFLIIVYAVYRRQLGIQRKKSQELNELNASKLTAIQSQMNPHFIFNSLNSIQDLVLKGEVENSYSYLTSFSDLVRRTLNYSDKDFIDFEQELQLIKLYLSLEKLRFKKSIEFEISAEHIEGIMIPPLLIQPFIENALVHGLLHKEGEKNLKISFSMHNEILICIIHDNGIGRVKAKEIIQRRGEAHESFSGKAINKRFEILSKVFREQFGYTYEDLYENAKPAGTKVILKIPVKYKF